MNKSTPVGFLALVSCLSPFGVAVMAPLIPELALDLERPVTELQWLVSAYVLGLALTQPLVGVAADFLGHRLVLLSGFGIFVVASGGLTLTTDFEALVALRFLQAMGAGVGTVIARGLISDQMSPGGALRAFATLTAAMGFTPIVAPILAGFLVTTFDVASVFLLLSLLGIILWLGCWYLIIEPVTDASHGRFSDYLRGYTSLLRSRLFWQFTLAFGCLQGMFFALLACAGLIFEEQFGVGVRMFSVVWSGMAVLYIIGSTLLNQVATCRTVEGQRRTVTLLVATCCLAILGAGLLGLTPLSLLLPQGLLMLCSGLLTPSAMLGAVNAVPSHSAAGAGLSSAGAMVLAATFTYLGSHAYDNHPPAVIAVVAMAGLGFAGFWHAAQRTLHRREPGHT